MKLSICTAIVAAALFCSCSRVPPQASASASPQPACPEPSYIVRATVIRESDAGKAAHDLSVAKWQGKVDAANAKLEAAKALKPGPAREKAFAACNEFARRLNAEIAKDNQAADAKLDDFLAAAAKKLYAEKHVVVEAAPTLAGGQDVSAEVVALMNKGTPEAVAADRAKDAELKALREQLAERKAPQSTPR